VVSGDGRHGPVYVDLKPNVHALLHAGTG